MIPGMECRTPVRPIVFKTGSLLETDDDHHDYRL